VHPLLLTRDQAAEALGLPARTVDALVGSGEIPVTDLGDGVIRIAHAALEQFILRHTPGVGAGAVAAPAGEPSVVLTQEDPMTAQITTPPEKLPRGMQWRPNADGTRSLRVRVQRKGEPWAWA
jgi:excisionase family DNA binding protein